MRMSDSASSNPTTSAGTPSQNPRPTGTSKKALLIGIGYKDSDSKMNPYHHDVAKFRELVIKEFGEYTAAKPEDTQKNTVRTTIKETMQSYGSDEIEKMIQAWSALLLTGDEDGVEQPPGNDFDSSLGDVASATRGECGPCSSSILATELKGTDLRWCG
ncbi:hypothetical protein MSAN_01187000 [Mycena sanguinolenta]|uniref:Uncharacterized protein n=1 Tax=Mycena sanguinolenta TaxID=230812 RepID=A0A8H6YNE6_9AGAR|nr:hypothetical protein MSAN_01187000 [Mycena sanguinolenta]